MSCAMARGGESRAPTTGTSRTIVILCLIAGAVAWARLGREYAGRLRPGPNESPDFYQEWASARNYLDRPAGVFSPRRDDAAVPGTSAGRLGAATSRTMPIRRPRCCWPCP